VNHSIPDGCGIYIKTPAGTMVHTGDFKFDFSPADGLKCEFAKIADIGREGVDVIFADSTNARKPDFCKSERVIGETLDGIVRDAKGRLIIASFSSLVGRIQQIVNSAQKYGRKVFIEGRSMVNNIEIAIKLGYIKIPTGIFRKMGPQVNELPPHEVLIIMTGSQGEPMSALSRIARDEHRFVKVDFQDTVVLSASPIPGNERPTYNVIDSLHRKGAQVITNDSMDVHISGHAHQGDLKLMHSLVMPKYIVPIHGEYFMRLAHREMVIRDLGYEEKNSIMLENGSVLEISNGLAHKSKEKIITDPVFVDGLGVGDVGTQILRERQTMAGGGVVVVSIDVHSVSKTIIRDPILFSRGFLENKHMEKNAIEETKVAIEGVLKVAGNEATGKGIAEAVVRHLQGFFLRKIDREPMILPIVRFV
jgi:ribonuclease J